MCTKVVTLQRTECVSKGSITDGCNTHLRLKEVSGDNFTPVSIKEGKSSAECRSRYSPENSLSNDTSPTGLCLVDSYK